MSDSIFDHKHIVIGSEHYNPLNITRSLGENGIKVIAVIIKGRFKLFSESKFISEKYFVNNIEDGIKLILEKFSRCDKKPFIHNGDDEIESYLDYHYDELNDKFIFYNAGKTGRINEFIDKENILKLANKYGFNTAKTIRYKIADNKNIILPNDISYPIITKAISPTLHNWKADSYICNNEIELKNAIKQSHSNEILIQEFIDKSTEFCLDGYSCNKGRDLFLSIKSTYHYRIEGAHSNYMRIENVDKSDLTDKLKRLYAEIGYDGISDIEFIVGKNGKIYFGEINFRNNGWSYASVCAGMNLQILWAKSMLTNKIDEDYYKTFKPFDAILELADFRTRVIENKMNIIIWLKEYIKCKCKFYFGKGNDIVPFFSYLLCKAIK